MMSPTEVTLTLAPEQRFQAIDVNAHLQAQAGDVLRRHRRVLYTSFHTTAGYLDQSLSARLQHRGDVLARFFGAFHALFPRDAGYRHDLMELRAELTDEQKRVEPRNGDSHLTFIGAGMRSCVTYRARHNCPVYFIDLDGRSDAATRERTTTIVAYERETTVARVPVTVPVSRDAVDAVDLGDPRLGIVDQIDALVTRAGVRRARVDVAVDPGERHVGITVNEYETLLMQHDLVAVLSDPLRFAHVNGHCPVADPLRDALGLEQSSVERLVAKALSRPARHIVKSRRVSFLAGVNGHGGAPRLLRGRYQTPILVQWQPADAQQRRLQIEITELS